MSRIHSPVLLDETLRLLDPKPGESYLDLTAGFGGHAAAVLERTQGAPAVLVDRDREALEYLKTGIAHPQAAVVRSDYESYVSGCRRRFDLIMADLGVSSLHLDDPERGFSFQSDGPLDMRMDRNQELTAAQIINQTEQNALADLIYEYGEERQSRNIARAIVANRPFQSTRQLSETIAAAYRGRRGRIHPATRTFQALRIAVNDELGQLERTLPQLPKLLNPDGRIAIISFHSLEDRKVKWFIRESESLVPLNKKALQGKLEDVSNPRARSAKLRAAVKKVNPFIN